MNAATFPGLRMSALHVRSARRVIGRRGLSLRGAVTRPDERMVFVIGSPRSGTTFLARAIGSCPGMVDLGEVAPLKASIPRLAALPADDAAPRIRRLLTIARRLTLTGGARSVEQTPETAFLARGVHLAFPEARLVHIVRDGRDVVCSLLDKGWLRADRRGADDAGLPFGAHRRFWVEPGRDREFHEASDARRAAWAWRRYVEAARVDGLAVEVRYEQLVTDPPAVARSLAGDIDLDEASLRVALEAAVDSSVGRFRDDLSPRELADVEAEAGELLRSMGYR